MGSGAASRAKSEVKPGRNAPCWCNSGRKYKYCHYNSDRDRIVTINPAVHPPGTPAQLNYKDDFANIMAPFDGPLHRFCRDNDFYLFGSTLTVGDMETAYNKLVAGTLTKQELLDALIKRSHRHVLEGYVKDACAKFSSFADREKFLLDAVEAHFTGKYTLSVPVLFAQLEGILRQIGALTSKDNIKPTIKRNIWGNRLLFAMEDAVEAFNSFISKLYEGQKDDGFNRNPVLHGMNLNYDNEEYSLILLLAICEVRTFLWFEENTEPVV
ncbi:YecA family protein [Rhizobium multihospitium]|uniref:YecA family protein n=1 Tax=Rhizobium multihospitium TaxID=410764 RepID=UPI001FD8C2D5|nr:SEC-C domain-containing protein [Rhizobium multihospitium]